MREAGRRLEHRTWARRARSAANASSMGCTLRHAAHHVAWKSAITSCGGFAAEFSSSAWRNCSRPTTSTTEGDGDAKGDAAVVAVATSRGESSAIARAIRPMRRRCPKVGNRHGCDDASRPLNKAPDEPLALVLASASQRTFPLWQLASVCIALKQDGRERGWCGRAASFCKACAATTSRTALYVESSDSANALPLPPKVATKGDAFCVRCPVVFAAYWASSVENSKGCDGSLPFLPDSPRGEGRPNHPVTHT